MSRFKEKFTKAMDGALSGLKLSGVNIHIQQKVAEFCFVVPESEYSIALESKQQIIKAINSAYSTKLHVDVHIKKSHFDEYYMTIDIIGFFDTYPSLKGCITRADISIVDITQAIDTQAEQEQFLQDNAQDTQQEQFLQDNAQDTKQEQLTFDTINETDTKADELTLATNSIQADTKADELTLATNSIKQADTKADEITLVTNGMLTPIKQVIITMQNSVYCAITGSSIITAFKDYLSASYCEAYQITFKCSQQAEEFKEDVQLGKFLYEDGSGREIQITDLKQIVGKKITHAPKYIVDSVTESDDITLCGKITDLRITERNSKQEEGVKLKTFKFTIDDTTGRVPCVYFSTKKTEELLSPLGIDSVVAVRGRLENNIFRDVTTLTMYPSGISSCVFPPDFKINRLKYQAAEDYICISPQPYVEATQIDLINAKQAAAEYLIGKQFVVFDLETTGLSRAIDKIIEIGAVKIVDGVIKQTFSTFINPGIAIPEKITKLTGITDSQVKDAPMISDVMPDFFKFCEGAVLVGHNSDDFDYPFISYAAAKDNIYFDNPRLDTLSIARKYLKQKKFTLEACADFYDVRNPHAHRAIHDAITTAKVFIRLAEFLS